MVACIYMHFAHAGFPKGMDSPAELWACTMAAGRLWTALEGTRLDANRSCR